MSLFPYRARSAVVLLTAVALAACDDRATPNPSEPQHQPSRPPRLSLSDAPVILVTNSLASPITGSKSLTDAEISALRAGSWSCVLDTEGEEDAIGGSLKPAP